MRFWERLEKSSKTMEKWHNKLYKFACIGMFILISDIIGVGIIGWSMHRLEFLEVVRDPLVMFMYDFIVYVGSPILYIFLTYTLLFTTFQFPIRFKGDGHGKEIKPITPN